MNHKRFKARLETAGIYFNEEVNLADSFRAKILISWRDKAIGKASRIFRHPDLQADCAASELISLMKPMLRNTASWFPTHP